jgi:hypothetical protein
LRSLFKKDKAEALYLFAALSSAGEVGDHIARSPLLDDLYRSLKDSPIPDAREPFDLIDLLSFLRIDGDKLRLPPAVELLLTADRATERKDSDRKQTDRKPLDGNSADPVAAIIRQIEKTKTGRAIPIIRSIAALDHIGRERPDWVADLKSVDLLAKQISAGRESQVELALDLLMSPEQVELYLSRIDRVDAISTPGQKQATACLYQAALELLRVAERNGVVKRARIAEATTLLLDLDPGSEHFASDVITVLRTHLLGAASPLSGQEFEKQLITVLAAAAPYVVQNDNTAASPSGDRPKAARFYQFDASKSAQERIIHNLGIIRHTRLSVVIDAAAELGVLEKSPSDSGAIQRLKAALAGFIESEPQPPPKKTKSKQPVVSLPTIKEIAAQLSAPMPPNTIKDLQRQIAPFFSQALLGAVYAAESNPDPKNEAAYTALVLNHDMSGDPWGNAEFDRARRCVRGGLPRLGYALINLEPRRGDPTSPSAGYKPSAVELPAVPRDQIQPAITAPDTKTFGGSFLAIVLNSIELVNHRLETRRALEFVSRSIDLGEDVLGLYLRGDQTARTVFEELDQQLTPRRAHALRASLEGSEIKKALTSLSLSELNAIGQRYFASRLSTEPLANLVSEPGALGVMANTIGASRHNESQREVPEDLRSEMRQLGLTMSTRTGLMRLDLRMLEPYEQSLTVEGTGRLIERLQDFKLALARACYRRGQPPSLGFSRVLVRAAVGHVLTEMEKEAGRTPPARDWPNLLKAIQAFDEATLSAFIEKLTSSSYATPVRGVNWRETNARAQ